MRPSLGSIFGAQDDRPPLASIFSRDDEEERFRAWYSSRARRLGLDPNPDDPRHHYDYRAAFKAGAEPDPATGHWPSEYKAEGHPRRVLGIVDTATGKPRPSFTGGLEAVTPEPQQSVGDRAVALADRALTAAAEGVVAIPEILTMHRGASGHFEPGQYPTIGKPGGFLDLKAQREDIRRQYEGAKARMRGSEGDPLVIAAADTVAEVTGQSIPFLRGARAAGGALEAAGERGLSRVAPAVPAARAADSLAEPTVQAAERRANTGLRGAVDEALARLHADKPTQDALADLQARAAASGDRATEIATERYAHDLGSGHFAPPAGRPTLDEIFGPPSRQAAPPAHEPTPGPQGSGGGREIGPQIAGKGPIEAAPQMPGLTTGTKHAVTRAERLAQGLPAVESEGRKASATWTEAKRVFDEDPEAPRALAQRLAEKPRPITDMENDLLLHDRMKMTLDHREALAAEDAALAVGDQEGAATARLRRVSIEEAKNINDHALDLGGTEWGRAGQARQKLVAEDYSPLHLQQRYRVASGGGEAPEPVRRQLTEISARLDEANARAAAAEERAQELEALRLIKSEQAGAAKVARSGKRVASAADLDAEFEQLRGAWRASVHLHATVTPQQAAIMGKMARNRVRAGVNNLTDLIDTIYNEASPHLPNLEPRDVRDAIAGASPTAQKAARSQLANEFAQLRREARVLNALEDAQAKLAGPVTEADRNLLEGEVRRWQGELDKLAAGTAGPGYGPLPDRQRISAAIARNARRLAELQEQIATGEVVPRTRAPISTLDLITARADVKGLKLKADKIIRARELQNRGAFDKSMDWTAGWGRFVKLTGVATLQKIGAAASERALIFKPMEELIGAGLSKLPVISKVAARAPIEGGGSIDAIAKSFSGFFGQRARTEMKAYLRGGEGPLSLAMEKGHLGGEVPAWMEYPGKVHAALKSPARVAGYEFAMEKQAKWYLKQGRGEELLNPAIQAEVQARAWEYAQRDIFMGDNAGVRKIRKLFADEPGQTKIAKASNTAGKVLLPIVKVPTNYALEVTDYTLGLPKGMTRLGFAIRKGLDELPATEAEQIMRQLKKGSLGAGLIALGASGVVKAGGYYEPGEHRGAHDLQPGEISVAGVHVPHMILHHPAVEALQVGAAIYRERKIQDGLSNAFWGVSEQVPFFEEPIRAARTLRSDPSQFFGSIERGMTLPPDIQRLARVLDQKGDHDGAEMLLQQFGWKHIDARRRKARGGFAEQLWEEEELGVPGLRQGVR